MHALISRLRVWGIFVWMLVTAPFFILATIPLLPRRDLRVRIGNAYGKFLGRSAAEICGTRVVVDAPGRIEELAPAIFLSNHTSALDIFIGMWHCPWGGCGVAKREMARIPVFGQLYALTGHLLIDRGNRDKAIKRMNETTDFMKKHEISCWIWPEGTRSRDGKFGPLKKGFVHMALATGLPIVPVVVHNATERWPMGPWRIFPGTLEISVLEPISTQGWSVDTMDQHLHEVSETFLEALGPKWRRDPDPG
jgi:1-acyl-sn-glycerol-3-phosphate acyltransferase